MADLNPELVLELDVGNTRVKWRCLDQGLRVAGGFLARSDYPDDRSCLVVLGERLGSVEHIDRLVLVRVGSVAASEFEAVLRHWIAEKLCVPVFVARSVSAAAGVVNGYESPEALGVDRWLAILAAQSLVSGDVCVVDCGSAVTVDFVSSGHHLGGYIVPGLRLMNEALFGSTDGVKVVQTGAPQDGRLTLGCSTADAVNLGLPAMVSGLVVDVCRRFELENGRRAQVVMTGGDAPLVASMLAGVLPDVLVEPDLVMDGLRLAL